MAETVLVTGGTGFVGGWCVVELLKHGDCGDSLITNGAV
jgi:uncharacterized protein YbjT (DUF2867 family)